MDEPELLLRSLLGSIAYLHRQAVVAELLRGLARGHRKLPVHQVDLSELVLHEEQLVDRHRAVVQGAAKPVAHEHRHVAERARVEVALVDLVVEVRGIARREQNLVHLLQVALDLVVLGELGVHRAQGMPLLVPRCDQGMHGGREPVKRQGRCGIEHLLGAALTLGFVDLAPLALEVGLARDDAVGNVLPDLLEIHALLAHALVLFEDVVRA